MSFLHVCFMGPFEGTEQRKTGLPLGCISLLTQCDKGRAGMVVLPARERHKLVL